MTCVETRSTPPHALEMKWWLERKNIKFTKKGDGLLIFNTWIFEDPHDAIIFIMEFGEWVIDK